MKNWNEAMTKPFLERLETQKIEIKSIFMMEIFFKNQTLRKIAFFFPIQLFLVVFKRNHLLLLFWLIFFGFITQSVAARYGVPFLFLNPEYMNKVDFWSYFIIGFSCGGFIMAFNISSYIMNGFRFPFLATLSNPFFKFCLNNFIIPVSFVIAYVIFIYNFQIHDQFLSKKEVILQIAGFLIGIVAFIFIAVSYFNYVNKDIVKMFGVQHNEEGTEPKRKEYKTQRILLRKDRQWEQIQYSKKEGRDWHVETYLSSFFSIRLARGYEHYEKEMLLKVFKQNHFNAAVFEVFAVASLLVLGLFREIPAFEIPAGASVFLLFSMFLMLSSAMHTMLRGWSTTAFIIITLSVNYIYHFGAFNSLNMAYGLNYKAPKALFNNKELKAFNNQPELKEKDINYTIEILNKWRLKNSENSLENQKKPKLVLINTSGGGLRSTLWTFYTLQYADSMLKGELLRHTQLITGSSGGMIGAAYLRELYLQYNQKKINGYYSDSLLVNVSKDMLNPVAFCIATNDLFFRIQKFKDGNYSYTKDRGYAFETKLNENTKKILDKRLRDYKQPEADAVIPMLILAPTIINDGRKLLISPQPISYLTQNSIRKNISTHALIECIEFSKFFDKQDAGNLKFASALRMNSTFPYIMPVVSLPSTPEMEVMDAGIRDNYGLETSLNFLYTFRNWVASNTSGVVVIQIRDRHKEFPVEDNDSKTVVQTLSRPLGSFYDNLFNIQDFNQNQLIQYASLWFDGKIDIIDFELRNEMPDHISLSWHLTNKEKKKVLSSINLPENQNSIKRLKALLE